MARLTTGGKTDLGGLGSFSSEPLSPVAYARLNVRPEYDYSKGSGKPVRDVTLGRPIAQSTFSPSYRAASHDRSRTGLSRRFCESTWQQSVRNEVIHDARVR